MFRRIMVATVACFAAVSCQKNQALDFDQGNLIVILEKEGVEYAYPHFSKDNREILFQSNEFGSWQICTFNIEKNAIRQLTHGDSNNYLPDWSPDNRLICFVSDKTGSEEIYVMDGDGGGVRALTTNGFRNIHPYFAPDGESILFSSTMDGRDDLEVYEMDLAGAVLRKLTESEDEETCARMSPDSDKLVYLKNNSSGLDDVFLLDLSDSSETNITRTATWDGWPSWSAKGDKLIFSAVEDDVFKLFAYRPQSDSLIKLTDPSLPFDHCRANMSADGSMVVFNRQSDSINGRTNAICVLKL